MTQSPSTIDSSIVKQAFELEAQQRSESYTQFLKDKEKQKESGLKFGAALIELIEDPAVATYLEMEYFHTHEPTRRESPYNIGALKLFFIKRDKSGPDLAVRMPGKEIGWYCPGIFTNSLLDKEDLKSEHVVTNIVFKDYFTKRRLDSIVEGDAYISKSGLLTPEILKDMAYRRLSEALEEKGVSDSGYRTKNTDIITLEWFAAAQEQSRPLVRRT